ncbi:MAG: RelA/SpoT domain-containing protein [Ilumatobacter sp.]|nr:RelA/SpoT domain-containing protein [Ilumatobacter sp.]
MGDRNDKAFGYAEFGKWYDDHRVATLEPALDRAMDALQHELDDSLSDRDLARIRSVSGRVKSKRRTWRKVNQQRYREQLVTVDDIPQIIDDLVGIRLTCTNLRDLEMVQAALENLPSHASKKRPLSLDPASERDYVDAPKESGYRGWHVNLGVALEGSPVTIELQVRTLLQDSWGELTHEDTYSKAGELPPLVEVLSARMADLLATLDDIAEDLRNELDRIDEAIVAETAPVIDTDVNESGVEPGVDALTSGPGADAVDLVVERWRSLDRPLELSSLAWALQNEFGAEVSDDWFGFRTFKRFLTYAVPDGEITGGPQAYLLPADGSVEVSQTPDDTAESSSEAADGVIPDEAQELRRIDRGFPLIETDQWHRIYEQLAEAWRRHGGGPSSTRMLNQITRSARDRAGAMGEPLSRRHLDHVAKTVFAAADAETPLTADEIGDVFVTAVLQRMAELRIVNAGNAARRTAIARWLLC